MVKLKVNSQLEIFSLMFSQVKQNSAIIALSQQKFMVKTLTVVVDLRTDNVYVYDTPS